MSRLLEQVNSPADLKKLTVSELAIYSREVREYILSVVEKRGGHLSSNLGAVELTVALHYVFDSPDDKLIFDVGHQSYTHKIITGRRDAFAALRTDEGVTGFPNAKESEHDHFTTGHSSTSLSLGLGMARARDLKNEDYNVVSVIGDGAFTGGMAFEALNDIGSHKTKMLVVLNDNKMSISENVGSFSEYLSKLRLSKKYAALKRNVKRAVRGLPFFGNRLVKFLDKTKEDFKSLIIPNKIFEDLGVKYYGPIDGHDVALLVDVLGKLKNYPKPAILHVITEKGKGVERVSRNPSRYHGVSPEGASDGISYASCVSPALKKIAELDKRVVAVTAAMSDGTGTAAFAEAFPDRFFDVGIAEQHAVSLCAGLAKAGMKPYFAVYSTFLQRAYDQIMHDVCLNRLPVTFLIDHAGYVDKDGETHQGLFDLSYLAAMPDLTVLQPKDGAEFNKMIDFSLDFDAPLAIRYPKNYFTDYPKTDFSLRWEYLKRSDNGVYVIAAGNRAIDAAMSVGEANVISARVIQPLDKTTLNEIRDAKLIITVEDGVKTGGFGERVLVYLTEAGSKAKIVRLGYDFDRAKTLDGTVAAENNGLTAKNIADIIEKTLKTFV